VWRPARFSLGRPYRGASLDRLLWGEPLTIRDGSRSLLAERAAPIRMHLRDSLSECTKNVPDL